MTPYEYHSLQIIQMAAIVLPPTVIFLLMLNISLLRKLTRLELIHIRSIILFDRLNDLVGTIKKLGEDVDSGKIDQSKFVSVLREVVSGMVKKDSHGR